MDFAQPDSRIFNVPQGSPTFEGNYKVNRATPAQRRACRLLLGGPIDFFAKSLMLVATSADSKTVVGSAALVPGMTRPLPGLKMALRVARPFRRRGVATALVHLAMAESLRKRMKALYAIQAVAPESEEARGWKWLKFAGQVVCQHYELDPKQFCDQISPLVRRMQGHGWIPQEARIVTLAEAPIEPVADLSTRYVGGFPRTVRARLQGHGPHAFCRVRSKVLMLGKRVVGILLANPTAPDISSVDSVAVVPELRLGWANLFLKHHAAEEAVNAGRHVIRFVAYDIHEDTHSLAKLVGARLSKRQFIPYRELPCIMDKSPPSDSLESR